MDAYVAWRTLDQEKMACREELEGAEELLLRARTALDVATEMQAKVTRGQVRRSRDMVLQLATEWQRECEERVQGLEARMAAVTKATTEAFWTFFNMLSADPRVAEQVQIVVPKLVGGGIDRYRDEMGAERGGRRDDVAVLRDAMGRSVKVALEALAKERTRGTVAPSRALSV